MFHFHWLSESHLHWPLLKISRLFVLFEAHLKMITQAHVFNKGWPLLQSNNRYLLTRWHALTSGFIFLCFLSLSLIFSLENKYFRSLSSRYLTESTSKIWKKITNWHYYLDKLNSIVHIMILYSQLLEKKKVCLNYYAGGIQNQNRQFMCEV